MRNVTHINQFVKCILDAARTGEINTPSEPEFSDVPQNGHPRVQPGIVSLSK